MRVPIEDLPSRPGPAPDRLALAAALLLVATLALALRFWQLATIPPGLHYDEAYNALHALRVIEGRAGSVYIQDEYGEEPMHIVLTALLFAVTGPTAWGGRAVSAASGVVAVVGLYFLGVEIFRRWDERHARPVALLSSLFLATWYWSFHYNRIGMEPSMVPMMAIFAMLFLWRALRTRRLLDWLLAGAGIALSLYTYPAGRAVPLVAALVVVHDLIAQRPTRRSVAGYGLLAATAFLFYLPLLLVFIETPGWFFLRIRQTTAGTVGGASPLAAAWQGALSTLLGFFWRGDQNWRQNLPGRPMFDPAQFVVFLVGLAVCVRRIRTRPSWFLLAWTGVALLPTVLTEYAPHFGRSLGATPPLALLAGLGLWTLARWVRRWAAGRLGPLPRYALAAACLGLPLAYSGGRAIDDYFNRWARDPNLYIAFDTGLRTIGQYVAELPATEAVYLSPVPEDWYTLRFAVKDDPARLRSFNGRECLVFPARTDVTTHMLLVVVEGEDTRSLARLQPLFPAGRIAWQTANRGTVYAVDYAIPPGQTPQLQPRYAVQANFDDQAALVGYDLSPQPARAGETLRVSLYWHALARMARDYTVFVHLVGPPQPNGSIIWAQNDTQPCERSYPTTRWLAGDIIWDDYELALPAGLPPGTYSLYAGLYDLATGQRLAVVDASGSATGDAVLMAQIEVRDPAK